MPSTEVTDVHVDMPCQLTRESAIAFSSCACARESASSLSCVSMEMDWLPNTTNIAAVRVRESIANAIKITSLLTPRFKLPNDRAFLIYGGVRRLVLLREHDLHRSGDLRA